MLAYVLRSVEVAKFLKNEEYKAEKVDIENAKAKRETLFGALDALNENQRDALIKTYLPEVVRALFLEKGANGVEIYSFLTLFNEMAKELATPAFLSSSEAVARVLLPLFKNEEIYDFTMSVIDAICRMDKALYGEVVFAFGRVATEMGYFDMAKTMLENASPYVKALAECRFLELCVTLGVKNEREFLRADGFSKQMPEYINLLVAIADDAALTKHYTELAEKNLNNSRKKPKLPRFLCKKTVDSRRVLDKKRVLIAATSMLLLIALVVTSIFVGPNLWYLVSSKYVQFGEYPQSLKADDVTIDESQMDSRGYYLGSDGAYYAKQVATFPEDLRGNDFYELVEYGTFENGTKIVEGETYYFKVEPIRWRILATAADGRQFLIADRVLANRAFDNKSNEFGSSQIYFWLNTTFMDTAFNEEQQSELRRHGGNYAASGYLVGLPTLDMVLDRSYGFSSRYNDTRHLARHKIATDYARATGVYFWTVEEGGKYFGQAYWWCSTPMKYDGTSVETVTANGFAGNEQPFTSSYIGVVPVIQVVGK